MDASRTVLSTVLLFIQFILANSQQQCYYGPGAEFAGPSDLVPCSPSGESACCLLGSYCLSGNACYDPATGNTYQYGCTDETYSDPTCPYKCGLDPLVSPWVGMQTCHPFGDINVNYTWVCTSPESCGCEWEPTFDLLKLPLRTCEAMGDKAVVALVASPALNPAYASLPSNAGESTLFYSIITADGSLAATPISGYTPSSATQPYTFSQPTAREEINPNGVPDAATYSPAILTNGSIPSSIPLVTFSTSSMQDSQISSAASSTTSSTVPSTSNTIGSSTASSDAVTISTSQYPTQSPSETSASPTTSSTTATNASKGLSTGAKAGIGVGVTIGALCIIAVVVGSLFYRRRLKNNSEKSHGPELMSY